MSIIKKITIFFIAILSLSLINFLDAEKVKITGKNTVFQQQDFLRYYD